MHNTFVSTAARTAVAVAIGAGAMFAASAAHAQIVYSGPVNLTIPATTAGIYLNVVTGAFGTTPAAAPGWDLNPWSSTGLAIWANNASETQNGVIVNAAGGSSATLIDSLPAGFVIGAGSTYGRTAGVETTGPTAFALNSTNLIGFRFTNETGGNTVHFGWARIAIGATLNDPSRAILDYAFELTPNTAIQAGVVPEPGTYALMALGLLGVAGMARRRMAKQD